MKYQLSILLLMLSSLAFSQNGIINGIITDNTQTPLIGVNVSIKNTSIGTQSNENGIFEINSVESGDYILSISYLGFKNREVSISISDNQNLDLGK